jgi:nucleoside-diphosphate-sugar epimerase
MEKILVTGASGQIGSALTAELRDRYGPGNVVAAVHLTKPCEAVAEGGPCVSLDVRDSKAVARVFEESGADTVFHLAAILSATAETDPRLAWDVNMRGLCNILDAAASSGSAVFFPSSIGAFGPTTPRDDTPQETIQRPETMYGITKVTGELLCEYYRRRYEVDARGLRFPGLISYETLPGGGTTDYAVEIFHAALTTGHYTCFLDAGTRLDMMYMPDAVRAAIELMEADLDEGSHRNAYNVTAFSIAPEDLAAEIARHVAGFTVAYEVDPVRQAIAESWPRHMDDSTARREWGWSPRYDLRAMTADMLAHLRVRLWKDGYGEGPDF